MKILFHKTCSLENSLGLSMRLQSSLSIIPRLLLGVPKMRFIFSDVTLKNITNMKENSVKQRE